MITTFEKQKIESEKSNGPQKSFIASGIELDATLIRCAGVIEVNGIIRGNFESTNTVELLSEGTIIGNISSENALVSGNVKGNIGCRGFLEVSQTANIEGDIAASSIEVEHGATIAGTIKVVPRQFDSSGTVRKESI